jgi:hypothetical protein
MQQTTLLNGQSGPAPSISLIISTSLFNMNKVLLSTVEHFKISGSCCIFSVLLYAQFCYSQLINVFSIGLW